MYTLYNISEEWHPMSKEEFSQRMKDAFDEGRRAGFQAGFAAAQQQPQAKIEAAYEQGVADATKLQPVRKNGVGY